MMLPRSTRLALLAELNREWSPATPPNRMATTPPMRPTNQVAGDAENRIAAAPPPPPA